VPGGARADDVLDALVLATVAHRHRRGEVERLGDGALDARGLRMEIVV
jgi:predicted RNase H-like nuclease